MNDKKRLEKIFSLIKEIDSTPDVQYIEKDIELYKLLTQPSFLFPYLDEKGELVDSITLMPDWIRDMLKDKDGKPFNFEEHVKQVKATLGEIF